METVRETDKRMQPDFRKIYHTILDDYHGYSSYVTHYIRFFPDGTLRAVAAPDFEYTDDSCYQDPWYIENKILLPGCQVDNNDPFGILGGTYTMEGKVLHYRIMMGNQIFEEGTGYFYGKYYSTVEEMLHVDFHNHYWDVRDSRGYGTFL